MFDFAENTKEMTAGEILNYYRNLYYAEPQVTERGIVASAINDFFREQPREIEWISVEERLPKPEVEVLILAIRKRANIEYPIITNAMYEDGTVSTDESDWNWYDLDFDYDEENDRTLIPKGWWEYNHYNTDDTYNCPVDDKVTHWMPLPEPPKGE